MKLLFLLTSLVLFFSCSGEPEIGDDMLDGEFIIDSSLVNPGNYLLSAAYPTPTQEQKNTPLIIAAHGYTATTFEWLDFRNYLNQSGDVLISQVLLGGHGTSYKDFKSSSWQNWQSSIKLEYDKLVTLGYENISLAGSSTGGALIIDLLARNYFSQQAINEVFLIDPIVIASNKILSLAGIVGPLIGYIDTEKDGDEVKYWYRYRPQETLQELNNLINIIRHSLEDGIDLQKGTRLKVYKSERDEVADPVSAVLIYKGIRHFDKSRADIQMVDSDIHVFTNILLENNLSQKDHTNKDNSFADMQSRCLEK